MRGLIVTSSIVLSAACVATTHADLVARFDPAPGITLVAGESLSATEAAELSGTIKNNGTIFGPAAGEWLTFTGQVSGAGGYTGNVAFDGQFSPGNSPAVVPFMGNLTFGSGNTLIEELAGTALGQYDRLEVTGNMTLAGALMVTLISPFTLGLGQTFEIIDVGGTRMGQFNGLGEGSLVGNFSGVDLFISYAAGDGNDVSLFTSAVPESGWVGAVGVALATLCGWWATRARSSLH